MQFKTGDKLDFFHNYYSPFCLSPALLKKQEILYFLNFNHHAAEPLQWVSTSLHHQKSMDYTPLTFYLASCRPRISTCVVKTADLFTKFHVDDAAVKPACSAPQNPSGKMEEFLPANEFLIYVFNSPFQKNQRRLLHCRPIE
jgi:hypothetical protein